MTYPKRNQYRHAKTRYRVRNGAAYERGLQARGSLTLWLSQDAIDAWRAAPRRRRGGQPVYSRVAIETALTVRMVYGLALRQAEGLLRSVFELLELDLPVPDHTTLSRRARTLGKVPLQVRAGTRPIQLLVDSTGLSVHVGHRRPPKGRRWRKLHLGVDPRPREVTAAEVTAQHVHDSRPVPRLLRQVDRGLARLTGDGAYDSTGVYEAVEAHAKARGRATPAVVVPPRRRARLSRDGTTAARQRNRQVRAMRKQGRRAWHKASGYSRRSLVENAVFRYKVAFGDRMRARSLAGQRLEARIGCRILNRMAQLGMPDSVRAA